MREIALLTLRDRLCLPWIGMQYAIRLDQLQRLLWRYTPEADRYKLKPGIDSLSLDRTYDHIRKWLAYKLVEKKTILHGDHAWVWLSRSGLRFTELSFSYGDGAPAMGLQPNSRIVCSPWLTTTNHAIMAMWPPMPSALRWVPRPLRALVLTFWQISSSTA